MNQSIYNIARNLVESKREKNSKYKKFKQAVLSYYGVNTPDELDPAKKKQFYKYIDIEWKRFKTSLDSNVSEHVIISENLFSKVDAEYLDVSEDMNDGDINNLQELLGKDVDLKSTELTDDELITRIKKSEEEVGNPENIARGKSIGHLHKKRIADIKIIDEHGVRYDLDKLKAMITKRPDSLLGINKKMQHGSDKFIQFFNIGLAAMKSLVYDEEKSKFVVVNTCPGAGKCILGCYALKGNFIMTPFSSLSRAQKLNFLLNDPNGFKNKLSNELSNKVNNLGKQGIDVHIRWHDAGDFFSKDYLQIAIDIAKQFPKINFYAYTKMAHAANASLPSNFLVRFSVGATPGEQEQVDFSKALNAEVVPVEDFKDLFVLAKNKRPASDPVTKQWSFKDPVEQSKERLKQIVANKYSLDINKVLLHDEYMEQRDSLSDDGGYHIIIYPGNSDFPATDKRVKTVYNLEH